MTYEYICSDNIWEHIDGMTVKTINKNKISVCLNCKREIELINFLPKEKQIKLCSGNMKKFLKEIIIIKI